ncbi:MAG: ABC transporter substrate-binding protein [Ruminococcus sp.]|nr:ABC transporter substrate-binding protein [Ruminococcus sp.]
MRNVCCFNAFFICCDEETVVTSQEEQIEISFSWWGNYSRNIYTIEAIDEFEKLYPNIKVSCDYSEWSGYETRSNICMVSNTESDIMQLNYAWLSQYSENGSGYYDLEEFSDIIGLSNFDDEVLEYERQNEILNAIPIAMNTKQFISIKLFTSSTVLTCRKRGTI